MPYRLDIPGWMRETDLKMIEQLARHVPEHGSVLEIGSLFGRSAWTWAMSIPETATIHCIDIWRGIPIDEGSDFLEGDIPDGPLATTIDLFLKYTKDCRNLTYVHADYIDVVPAYQAASYDLIFLDAWHENPGFHDEINLMLPLLKPQGVFCGHDFNEYHPDVRTEVVALANRLRVPIQLAPDCNVWAMIIS
jgi:predicted O-methyltransferase YrrM